MARKTDPHVLSKRSRQRAGRKMESRRAKDAQRKLARVSYTL